uniref:Flavin-containing monooxygenase n=1 Tax=Oryza brachyantha TaxID=4533 RepID=J3LE73_ORYBR
MAPPRRGGTGDADALQWVVRSMDAGIWRQRADDDRVAEAQCVEEVFDAVVVATGHYSQPRLPSIEGVEDWRRRQLHSHSYRVPDPFRDEVVVVVGCGDSGMDIALELRAVAREVHLSAKSVEAAMTPAMSKMLARHANLRLRPQIERLCADGRVVFADGTCVVADTVMYCTGYRYSFPFLDTDGRVTVDDNRVGPLFEHTFPPSLAPSLSFVGIPRKVMVPWFFEAQGRRALPTEEEMTRSVEDYYRARELAGVLKKYTHDVEPHHRLLDLCVFMFDPLSFGGQKMYELGEKYCDFPRTEDWKRELMAIISRNTSDDMETFRDRDDDSDNVRKCMQEWYRLAEHQAQDDDEEEDPAAAAAVLVSMPSITFFSKFLLSNPLWVNNGCIDNFLRMSVTGMRAQQPYAHMLVMAARVEGMRKAYAEIMLNMAQESAARVLAAERRAAALAGGLAAAREDGVAALVRLKAIMEARIKEVESQSLAHIKKIKELQEQLHGAQDTVASLQFELQRSNSELEQARSTLAEERRKDLRISDKISYNKNSSSASKKPLQDRLSSKSKSTAKEGGAVENVEILYRCDSDLGSFMARTKNPELYRNGCTQRIRAIKQRSPSADTSNSKQISAVNSHSKTGKTGTDRNPCSTRSIMEQILQTKFLANCKRKRGRRSRPSYMHDNSVEHGQTEYKSSDTSGGNGCLLLLQALEQDLSPLKASAEHGSDGLADQKDGLAIDGKDADWNLHPASPGPNDVLSVNNMQMKRRKRSKTIRVFESEFEAKGIPELGNTLPKSTNNMFISEQSSDTPPGNTSSVLQCTAENVMHVTDAANTGQLKYENSSPLVSQPTESEIVDEGNSQVDRQECRTPNNNGVDLEEMNVDKNCILASDGADSSIVSTLDKEENAKEAPSGVAVQAERARCIKYTFNRRKRKTASLDSTLQVAVPEKSSSLVCPAENHESHAKPETQDLLIESTPGDNQLIHVAQQLIMLSAQK